MLRIITILWKNATRTASIFTLIKNGIVLFGVLLFNVNAYSANWLNQTDVSDPALDNLALNLMSNDSRAEPDLVVTLLNSLEDQIVSMPEYTDKFSAACKVSFLDKVNSYNCAIDFSDNGERVVKLGSTAVYPSGYSNQNSNNEFHFKAFVSWKENPHYMIETGLFKAAATEPPTTTVATTASTTAVPVSGNCAVSEAVVGIDPLGWGEPRDVPALCWELDRNGTDYMFWQDAKGYCARKGPGWRLPDIYELHALYNQKNILSDDVDITYFWSSTTDAFSQDKAWFVSFYDGNSLRDEKYHTFKVRCCRNLFPTTPPACHPSCPPNTVCSTATAISMSDIVKNVSALCWESGIKNTTPLDWNAAKDHCAGKGAGWRLPNARELLAFLHQQADLVTEDDFVVFPLPSSSVSGNYIIGSGYWCANDDCWLKLSNFEKTYEFLVRCCRKP